MRASRRQSVPRVARKRKTVERPIVERVCAQAGCQTTVTSKHARYCPPCRSKRRRKVLKYHWTPELDQAVRDAYQGQKYRQKAVRSLMRLTGWPRHAVTQRARKLGVARTKETPWAKAEIDILVKHAWKCEQRIQAALKARGYRRTLTAIVVKRKRMDLLQSVDGYSAHHLAGLMGVDDHKVVRWIKAGWLKAQRRGQARTPGQGGDAWYIAHDEVRRFVLRHPDELPDLGKADRLWLLDLLTNGAIGLSPDDRGAVAEAGSPARLEALACLAHLAHLAADGDAGLPMRKLDPRAREAMRHLAAEMDGRRNDEEKRIPETWTPAE